MAAPRTPSKLEPVGPVLGEVLRGLGLAARLAEYRAVSAWTTTVGPAVAAHAQATAIQDGVLFVEVDSSVWLQELGLLRESIVERLNAELGSACVRRIVLSAKRTPLPGPREE